LAWFSHALGNDKAGESCDIMNIELVHDLLPVLLNRFDANPQLGCHFWIRKPVRGELLIRTSRPRTWVKLLGAQHAHQKGIIHRDIKPTNILVTVNDSVAVPKVIDFGIAKATTDQRLTDKTVFTAFEQFIGTPAYMSPEQAEITSVDVDRRSDIYSLGVNMPLPKARPPNVPALRSSKSIGSPFLCFRCFPWLHIELQI